VLEELVVLQVLDPVLEVDWYLVVLFAVDVPQGPRSGKCRFATQQFGCVEVDIEGSVVTHGADVVGFISTCQHRIFKFWENEKIGNDLGSANVSVKVGSTMFGQDDVDQAAVCAQSCEAIRIFKTQHFIEVASHTDQFSGVLAFLDKPEQVPAMMAPEASGVPSFFFHEHRHLLFCKGGFSQVANVFAVVLAHLISANKG